MKYLSILLFSALFLVSCGDREDPVVSFTSPANNTEVAAGETIAIQFKVTDNEAISSIDVGGDVTGVPTIDSFDDLTEHSEIINLITDEATPSGSEVTVTVTAEDEAGNSGSADLVLVIE